MKNKNSTCLCKKQNLSYPIVCALKNNPKKIYLILGLICVAVAAILIANRAVKPLEEISITEEEIRELVEARKEKVMKWNNPPEMMIDKEVNYTAIIRTSKGDIFIEFFNRENPITVNNFVFLAEQGFYNGIIFHRVIEDFMIQAGCPLGKGIGGPGYRIPCEIRPDNRNDRYTISMANAGPNTGGSQFFINVADNNFLDTLHSTFGRVIKGRCVPRKIAGVETGPGDRPFEDIVIKNIEIVKK